MEALLMSPDPRTRELMALTIRSIERRLGEDLRFRAAANGELALRAALRDRPEIVVADELASRMGAFALARSLRDAADPYTGVIVVLLERTHDAWLASWSGADAWYVKPADPFAVADRLWELLAARGLVREPEKERPEKERAEKERAEKERAEKERAEKERAEKERAEKERAEKERV